MPRFTNRHVLITDHTQQHTYAGHIWRLIDDKTKKPLHYFIVPKKPGKLIYKDR